MPRVKRGSVRRAKRKKLLARTKGFYATKSKLYRAAKEAGDKASSFMASRQPGSPSTASSSPPWPRPSLPRSPTWPARRKTPARPRRPAATR